MSIRALSWAIEQSMGLNLGSTDKLVLWQLADAHNIDNGCFITQETIAKNCEIGRATVNRCLDRLEETRLIRRQARIHPVTKQQLPTRYFLAFEDGRAPQPAVGRASKRDTGIPGPSGAEAGGDPVDNSAEDDEAVSQAVSHSSETQTLEPIESPLPPDLLSETPFNTLLGKWLPARVGSVAGAMKAWDGLSRDEQLLAVHLAEPTRSGFYGLGRELPLLGLYLSKRVFAEFDDAPEIVDGRFKITPQRPEWRAWMGWVRQKHGQRGVDSIVATGFLLVETRFAAAAKESA